MSQEKYEIKVILKHYWKMKINATEAVNRIRIVEGHDFVNLRMAQRYFKTFREGDTSLQRKAGSGRPCTLNEASLRTSVNENCKKGIRSIAADLDLPRETVRRHMHLIGYKRKRSIQIPHELTIEQCNKRLKICKQLANGPFDNRFIKKLITCDEKWIYYNNPDTKYIWLDKNSPADQVPKMERFQKKVMLSVWWNYEGVIHFELLPDGDTINSDVYIQQINRVYDKIANLYPALVNRNRIIIQQDNAKPHVSKNSLRNFKNLDIELLPHPPYSPDLAPSDFHLFRSMEHFLRGKKFETNRCVEMACSQFFESKTSSWYENGIKSLLGRWNKAIESDGLYFCE